ncbi:putative flavin carrier protein precursor [Podospora fimiseda]|uniref:Flavin carrier protein n=1 Tax=Podospora fimiseda TaxID=252190 RepID=A0AAN7BW51_9PEZI|nr:putative flavin carrier protein precursor [Podospora fimiseda]
MARISFRAGLLAATTFFFGNGVLGADILQTVGFNNCNGTAAVSVQRANIKYNNQNKTVSFDVAGTSTQIQNVTAILNVTAYGQNIYSNSFDPCDGATFVEQLCPVPAGTFSARGTQQIPEEFASLVPAIAFQIPDIAAFATLELKSRESGEKVACLEAQVTNGKTASVPAVPYVAAGIAGAALILGGVSAVATAFSAGGAAASGSAAGGMGTVSPSFGEVFGWFQGMAMNGMMSVNYPNVYRSFASNFGFSTGLIPWNDLQVGIDNFRAATGGNLTENSVEFLKNATLVFPDGSTNTKAQPSVKRAVDTFVRLAVRQLEGIETSIDTSATGIVPPTNLSPETVRVAVSGIQGYVQELAIPSGNTFMTILLIVAIIIVAIVVGVLLLKLLLEFWALFASFPKSLTGFRKHYWGSIGRTITHLILLLYGIWVLYCVFQFTHGDSWAAKTLAGITLFLFTGVLAWFSFKIWNTARRLRRDEGDVGGLYDDKDIWVKYSLFYESYRRGCWWIFVPTIVYMFAKGLSLAALDGNGMVQTSAVMIIEGIMLIMLVWSRPYERKSSNVINICIQVVRVLSVACIFVFVEQFGITQTTQTVAGVVLIAIQSALTGILAILIAWNAISALCKKNPHRQRRKEMEKMQRDTLTPLDARNSLLLQREKTTASDTSDSLSLLKTGPEVESREFVDSKPPISTVAQRYSGPEQPPSNPMFNHTRNSSSTSSYRNITPNNPYAQQPRLPSLAGDVYGYAANGYGRPNAPGGYTPGAYGQGQYGYRG